MNTRERDGWDAVVAPPLSPSVALVPLRAESAPAVPPPRPADGPRHAHRYFYGMGYAALGMFVLGAFFESRSEVAAAAFLVPGAMLLGLGGLGVLLHVIVRPSMAKLRRGLGAVASLALTLAALGPVSRVGQEVHATARIPGLQALADDLLRDGRIRDIGLPSWGWVSLNGSRGRLDGVETSGSEGPALYEVLRRDGISRLELVRRMRELEAAGVERVWIENDVVTFRTANGPDLLYVPTGSPLPPGSALPRGMRTRPVGGGWYLLLGGGWME